MNSSSFQKTSHLLSRRDFLRLSALTAGGLALICANPVQAADAFSNYPQSASDYFPGSTWRTATPESQGVDSQGITDMFQEISRACPYVHSFVLIRNGYLLTESYFAPVSKEQSHILFSATKSITSALVGIAIHEGLIKDVNQKVIDFFPKIKSLNADKNLDKLNIEHLLSMSTGHAFQVSPGPYQSQPVDWVEKFLGNPNNPILYEPGSTFMYTSGAPHTLSAILQKVSGKSTAAYAADKLFKPLGITSFDWLPDQNGITFGNSWLRLKPLDMARLGYLYLNQGNWNGKQIIPAEWVEQSTRKFINTRGVQINAAEQDGYGYLWWMNSFGGFSAHGYGGQFIFVIPALNLIAVFTGGFDDDVFDTSYKLMRDFIIPAVKEVSPISNNPGAYQSLQEWLDHNSNPIKKEISTLPEAARKFSGRTYIFPDKMRVSFNFDNSAEYSYKLTLPALNGVPGTLAFRGGLDDTYRLNDVKNGLYTSNITAVKGYWQNEAAFVNIEFPLDNVSYNISTCTFEEYKLTIKNEMMISGKSVGENTTVGTLL